MFQIVPHIKAGGHIESRLSMRVPFAVEADGVIFVFTLSDVVVTFEPI